MQSSPRAQRVRPAPRVTRGVRVLRGSVGALVATLLAAASHGLAGGVITWASVAATVIFTLPLCAALAGRVGSLWRLTAAVGVAQFVYHWTFAGLGLASTSAIGAPVESPHAAHFAALQSFAPNLASAGAADATMWFWHAAAAVLTIGLLHRGEHAFLALCRALRRVVLERPVQVRLPAARPIPLGSHSSAPLRDRILMGSAITHRGPPALV